MGTCCSILKLADNNVHMHRNTPALSKGENLFTFKQARLDKAGSRSVIVKGVRQTGSSFLEREAIIFKEQW